MVGDGRLNGVGPILAALLLVGLVSCEAPRSTAPDPANTPEPADVAPREAIATMQDIVADPVSVARGQAPPAPAVIGQGLAYGDQIRTEGTALAEAKLVTGPVFRIGGNAVLTLRPNQQLQLDAGQMITWVEGQPPGPVEIVTPVGIAGLRGTTAFVNIAEDPQAPIEIFSWEGEVSFRPTGATEDIILTSGEQLFVQMDDPNLQDIAALRDRVQPLDQATARQRLEDSALINGFSQPIPTRAAIESAVETLE